MREKEYSNRFVEVGKQAEKKHAIERARQEERNQINQQKESFRSARRLSL